MSDDGELVFVIGASDVIPGPEQEDYDLVVIAYEAETGARRWVATYPGETTEPQTLAQAAALSPDGSTLYVATQNSTSEWNGGGATVLAYTASDGAEISRTVHREDGFYSKQLEIGRFIDDEGELVERLYLGANWFGGFQSDQPAEAILAAYDLLESGEFEEKVWEQRYRGEDDAGAFSASLTLSPDGRTVFQGGGQDGGASFGRKDVTLLAYGAERGNRLWVMNEPVVENRAMNGAIDIAVTPDGSRLLSTGIASTAGGSAVLGMVTFAHDATTGSRLWRKEFSGPSQHFALMEGTLAISPDGDRAFVTASRAEPDALGSTHVGWSVVAYDIGSGQEEWSAISVEPIRRQVAFVGFYPALAVSPTEDLVYVTGPRGQHHVSSYVTAAYDTNDGTQKWMARFSRGSSYPTSLAVAPDGSRVFVAGTTNPLETWPLASPTTDYDIVTVAYDGRP